MSSSSKRIGWCGLNRRWHGCYARHGAAAQPAAARGERDEQHGCAACARGGPHRMVCCARARARAFAQGTPQSIGVHDCLIAVTIKQEVV